MLTNTQFQRRSDAFRSLMKVLRVNAFTRERCLKFISSLTLIQVHANVSVGVLLSQTLAAWILPFNFPFLIDVWWSYNLVWERKICKSQSEMRTDVTKASTLWILGKELHGLFGLPKRTTRKQVWKNPYLSGFCLKYLLQGEPQSQYVLHYLFQTIPLLSVINLHG